MKTKQHAGNHVSRDRTIHPRVLVLAFACDPYAGSEPGAGWGVVRTCAEVGNLVVLVPPHDMRTIEKWRQNHAVERITFIEVPFTRLGDTLGRLARFSNSFLFLWYLLWLRNAKSVARRLEAEQPFNASVHATIGSYWLPSPVVQLQAPSVWGAVGGATTTPWRLLRFLGWRGIAGEWVKWITVRSVALLPPTQNTWRCATIRIAESENTRRALPRALQTKTRVINRAFFQEVPAVQPAERKNYLLFPSALEPRKGPRLALHALAHTPPTVRLFFVADGCEQRALERLAIRLGVKGRTEFLGRIPRVQMFRMMAEAAAVVFTGLREEGGCALSEAMKLGTPVVVLGHGGARLIAEANTDPSRVALIEPASAQETVMKFATAMAKFSAHPSPLTGGYLDSEGAKRALQQALTDAMATAAVPKHDCALTPATHPQSPR